MSNLITTIYSTLTATLANVCKGKRTGIGLRLPQRALMLAAALVVCLAGCIDIWGRPAGYYTSSSRLSSGKWVKIKVEKTGIQVLTRSTLSAMGFTDISKVNVYGYGGAPISEHLTDYQPDDLPLLPCVRTNDAIYFFGNDRFRRDLNTSESASCTYDIASNPYSDDSFYFVSDAETSALTIPDAPLGTVPAETLTTFTDIAIHEQDLVNPSNTGRVLLGEDFRSPTTRSFTFQLPDNQNGDALMHMTFATRTTGAQSDLTFTANGVRLPSSKGDYIPAVTTSEQFMRYGDIIKEIPSAGNSLQLAVSYSCSGTIVMARMDYLAIEYTRSLRLRDGQLYFTHTQQLPAQLNISGCDNTTVVWDVTDPADISRVNIAVSGSTGSFIAPGGYRKYVAFNSSVAAYTPARGDIVRNQDIHAMEIPDMLIITPSEFADASNRIAEMRRRVDDMKVAVLTPETIYNEFSSGTPDVSAFRKLLKMWYDRAESEGRSHTRYCLLMSRPTFDHKTSGKRASWPLVPIWMSQKGFSQTTSYSTDDFIGMLDEQADNVNDFTLAAQPINVAVGRMAVTTAQEADDMAEKLITYVEKPDLGAWRNNVVIIADDQDNAVHYKQAESVYKNMTGSDGGKNYLYDRIYLDAYEMVASSKGYTYPEAKDHLLRKWNEGIGYINYIGHASPKEWGHEDLLNWNDINSFNNTRLPFLYAATCEFNRWDDEDRSGAEVLWLYPKSGIIATICPSRTVYITQNGILNIATHKTAFNKDGNLGKRIGDLMVDGKNNYGSPDDNKLRYALLGDPAMRIPAPECNVVVEKISDTDVTAADFEKPVIPARGKAAVSGYIARPDGTVDTSFNGILNILLQDAEKPIETNGNGENGVVCVYNDRKTELYSGSCRIVDGRWSTTLLMPSDIENNYSPARLTFYAGSDEGVEANGSSEDFYVYGYDDNADADDQGPDIRLLALNREDFADGDLVHSSPVVLANFSDASGINLSNAGIGHKITLRLDTSRYFDDVTSYYTPDPDDNTAGSVAYPMPELEAGEHTLSLTVWDNANNFSTRSITFNVGVAKQPEIYTLNTDVNPAVDRVSFLLSTDRPMAKVECKVEVFDLNGRTVWRSTDNTQTDVAASLSIPWNLCDSGGSRVPRGIYLYRATITSPEGTSVTESRKLAVTAP